MQNASPDVDRLVDRVRYAVIGLGWAWGLWCLWEATGVEIGFWMWCGLLVSACPIAALWAACWAVPRVRPRNAFDCGLMLTVPAFAALAFSLSWTDDGLKARLWLSESALQSRAESALQNQRDGSRGRIGLFNVWSVTAEPNQVLFQTGDGYLLFDRTGLVYRPDGERPVHRGLGSCSFTHLYGPWWRYHDHGD